MSKTKSKKTPAKPRLNPGRLASDLLKFAQWADCDETSKLETEFLELSRDESTGSQCHFLESLLFLRLATVSLLHAEHQSKFELVRQLAVDDEEADPYDTEVADSSLRLAQRSLKDIARIEQAIVDEIPE